MSVLAICIFQAFCLSGSAPAKAISAASSATASVTVLPTRYFSASVQRTGTGATAPSTMLALFTTPFSIS